MTDGALALVRKGDLYAVLALATKEELDPLVKVITARTWNMLDVKDEYKRHQPDHVMYHRQIGDELRLYGGNTLANVGRGGEGPSYNEIVADVCWKVSVPYEKGRTVENEANLLDIFFEQRWRSLSDGDRERMAASARETALGKTSEGDWYAKTGAAAIATLLSTGIGGAALGISVFDASYRVTVPCVLHVAFLRRKFLEEGRGHVAAAPAKSVRRRAGRDALAMAAGTAEPSSSLDVRDDDGLPVLSISRVPASREGTWHEVGRTDEISRLNSLVQAVPALGTAAELAGATGARYMEVVCSGDLMKAAKGGGWRAMSRNAQGITEHANLFGADKLAVLANASAVMNVASIALAQKHLADISEKLSALKDDVGRVATFQKAERRAVLTGSIDYFEQIAPSVLAGERSIGATMQIERYEADLLEVQHHLEAELTAAIEEIRGFKDSGWFSSSELVDKVEVKQREVNECLEQVLLCVRARAYGWQLFCHVSDGEIGKQRRRASIEGSLTGLDECGERLAQIDGALREKLRGASSFFSPSAMNERKLGILRAGDDFVKTLSAERERIAVGIAQAEDAMTSLERPFSIALKVEDGRVAAVQALEQASVQAMA